MTSEDDLYLGRQAQLFEQAKPQLIAEYNGRYVLFEDGKVLDSDPDRDALAMRTYQVQGMRVLFIELVSDEEHPPRTIWTPFSRR